MKYENINLPCRWVKTTRLEVDENDMFYLAPFFSPVEVKID